MFSVLVNSAVVLFLISPAASNSACGERCDPNAKIGFDLISNGKYWWGSKWTHRPKHGSTDSCICMKGRNPFEDYRCFKGMDFPSGRDEVMLDFPFDPRNPVDITIHGSDALWIDRFVIYSKAIKSERVDFPDGTYHILSGARFYGKHDTHGNCLSTDPNDNSFDQYAKSGRCFQTLVLWPDSKVYRGEGRVGHYRDQHLLSRTKAACARLTGRRRTEGEMPPAGVMVEVPEADFHDADHYSTPLPLDEDTLDEDPAGVHPPHVHNARDAQYVIELHSEIKQLIKTLSEDPEKKELMDGQIDSILNSAMLRVEQRLEREDGGEEVGVVPGSDETGSTAADAVDPLAKRLGA